MMEELLEGREHAVVREFARMLFVLAEVDGVNDADVFAQLQIAARLARFLLVSLDELAHHRRLRQQDRRNDAFARAPSDGLLADRKGLEQGRMRPLKRLRDDVHLLDAPLVVNLAREAVLARPFVRGPRRAFLRRRILIVLALETERLVAPRQLQEAEHLFEGFAIDAVALALVAGGGADVNLLRHLIQPAGLIAAREADERAPLGQLIEPRDFERQAQRIPSGQHVSDRTRP